MSVIDDHWNVLSPEVRVQLGLATSGDLPAGADGDGLKRNYQRGGIYWSIRTGVQEVYGAIYTRWIEEGAETGRFGFPVSSELSYRMDRGRYSNFENGSIYFDWGHSSWGAYPLVPPPRLIPPDPGRLGQWDRLPVELSLYPVHAALMPTGRVALLSYRTPPNAFAGPAVQTYGDSAIFDPATGLASPVNYTGPAAPNQENLFCSGHAFSSTGQLVIMGGERETDTTTERLEVIRSVHLFSLFSII